VSRWATFDCYGTLIDWNGGIRGVLEGLFGADRGPELLARYHRLEPEVQAEQFRSYAEVLSLTLERLAAENDLTIPEGETTTPDALQLYTDCLDQAPPEDTAALQRCNMLLPGQP